ncbi:MAG: tRNA lysidine(34) synthetase TilS [Candidatus Nomurabacteria bacterium]|jgi:tRNA(Ile)-lysidine synthetase-like protein|nr:tRNA lysidine(34) synthetase TilS [Candidatus Nomurabacteria bacterium]
MKILAVSGGVDSVTMLDMLAGDDCVVAHFNHGIRGDSDKDEQLVGNLAQKYKLPYEHKKVHLGAGASEELAREARYGFLREVAARYNGKIYTAHHADDVIESISINQISGTRWRGRVPLDNPDIERPLLGMFKSDILQYATKHNLQWHEDSTNSDRSYLRNRVRHSLQGLPLQDKREILRLYEEQKQLKCQIDDLVGKLLPDDGVYQRDWFVSLDSSVAIELLRAALERTGRSATRPQLKEFLAAIKTYKTGKKFNLPGDCLVRMGKISFKLL